jgi:hypothetical protein
VSDDEGEVSPWVEEPRVPDKVRPTHPGEHLKAEGRLRGRRWCSCSVPIPARHYLGSWACLRCERVISWARLITVNPRGKA